MRKFQGDKWTPPKTKRRGDGGAMDYTPMISGLPPQGPMPGAAQKVIPGQDMMSMAVKGAKRSGMSTPDIMKALASGVANGMGGMKGVAVGAGVNAASLIAASLIAQKQKASNLAVSQAATAGATPDALRDKKGGRIKMKGRTTNTPKTNTVSKNNPMPKKSGGMMKKKGC